MGVIITSFTDAIFVAISGVLSVFIMLACLAALIRLMARSVGMLHRSPKGAVPEDHPLAESSRTAEMEKHMPVAELECYSGQVHLYDTEEKTAVCLMAIVSHETGIPLGQLIFKSIRSLEGNQGKA